ncbi:hypothetical protein HYDPIDRAFT_113374 [Hydnomerulius pinastri MD-312]|uniref:DNA-binding protein RAP1 n=1 Tax=Hydnomerulius pinastri MD-312 TaxID=994086 RepID=A0A0C9VYG3_9AGAM|nr:hypothetical protein HYDPIDRAFT_113374 [Hydnomerulius pinastri MD-312]
MGSRAATAELEPENNIFTKDGFPVRFYFHPSVRDGRDQITRDVENHGGIITNNEREAHVLLVDEEADIELIRRRYYSSTDLFRIQMVVEPRGFVQNCLRAGMYQHLEPKRQGMPGPLPVSMGGRGRQNFTSDDDRYLAYYLATIYPDKATGGRLGGSAYKELMRLAPNPDFQWARRHTAQSWRERYKKQAGRLDPLIDEYAEKLKLVGHTFGHDPRSRRYRLPRYYEQEEEEDEENQQEEGEEEGVEGENGAEGGVAAARDFLAANEGDLIPFGERDDGPRAEQAEEGELVQRKRPRPHSDARRQSDLQESPAKRARVASPSSRMIERRVSGVEQGRRQSSLPRKDDEMGPDPPVEGEDDDLFGDQEYGDEVQYNFDQAADIENPMPHSPRSPTGTGDLGPEATQRTLVESPRVSNKVHNEAPSSSLSGRRPPESRSRQSPAQVLPPSSQMTLVATQDHAAPVPSGPRAAPINTRPAGSGSNASRLRNRAVPAPSTDAPYRNTRARSQSVDPEPVIAQTKDKGKGKLKQVELDPVPEDDPFGSDEPEHPEVSAPVASTSGLHTKETFDDEMAVEDLLEGPSLSDDFLSEDEEDDGSPVLPRFQIIEGSDEPSDSDDIETHRSLRQSNPTESRQSEEEHSSASSDSGLEDDDGDNEERLRRMANASLSQAPLGSAPLRRTTRSIAQRVAQASPARSQQIQDHLREPPFPSPGTRAREVVDRTNQAKRKLPYTPPAGSKAAKMRRG